MTVYVVRFRYLADRWMTYTKEFATMEELNAWKNANHVHVYAIWEERTADSESKAWKYRENS